MIMSGHHPLGCYQVIIWPTHRRRQANRQRARLARRRQARRHPRTVYAVQSSV
jgi:hypothetical protein